MTQPLNQIGLINAICQELDKQRPGIQATHSTFKAAIRAADMVIAAVDGVEEVQPTKADNRPEMAKMQAVFDAAEKLIRCKGRYHSELNYKALAALFGVTTPDLPPLEADK